MRDIFSISIAMTMVWFVVFFSIPELGYPIQAWTVLVSASLSAVYAGVIVLLGETIIEDGIKVAMFLVLSAVAWYADSSFSFILVCVVTAGGIGTVINHINRKRKTSHA